MTRLTALTLSVLLSAPVLAAPAARMYAAAPSTRLQQGQNELNRGNFRGALRWLDAAISETADAGTLTRAQLLRAQCFEAMQSFAKAEEALGAALEANPEAELDPDRVDPALVKMLVSLRQRLHGELLINASVPQAHVMVDGKPVGDAPARLPADVGRHHVEVRSADNTRAAARDVVVRVRQPLEVSVTLQMVPGTQPPPPVVSAAPETNPLRARKLPFADVRGVFEPDYALHGLGLEVGGGIEVPYVRVSAYARLYPQFGFTVRGAVVVPVVAKVDAYVTVEVPVIFYGDATGVALGAEAGAEYRVSPWIGPFFEIGVRHYFLGPGEDNRLVMDLGARLRIP